MPKVIINKREYRVKDFGSWVIKWLRREDKTMTDLGNELGISHQGISYKIKHNSFTLSDMITIFDYLNVPDNEMVLALKT